MLLKLIKTESYGVLRHKPFHPSLSAKNKEQPLSGCSFSFLREGDISPLYLNPG